MNSAPVSIKRLLMPLNAAVATKARRHAPSAAASSELTGCCCAGPVAWFIERCVPFLRTRDYARFATTGGPPSSLVAGHFAADCKASNIPTLQHILREITAD